MASSKNQSADLKYLQEHGWRERAGTGIYCWYHKRFPAACMKMADALELERRKK